MMISQVGATVKGSGTDPWRLRLLLVAIVLAATLVPVTIFVTVTASGGVHHSVAAASPPSPALHKPGRAFRCQGPNHVVTGTMYGPFPIPAAQLRETSQPVLEVEYQIRETNKNRQSIGEMMDHWIGLNDSPELYTPTGERADIPEGVWKYDYPDGSSLPYELGPSKVRFEVMRELPGSSLDGWKFVIGADSAPSCSFTLGQLGGR